MKSEDEIEIDDDYKNILAQKSVSLSLFCDPEIKEGKERNQENIPEVELYPHQRK